MKHCHGLAAYQKGATQLTTMMQLRFIAVLGLVSLVVAGLIKTTTGFNARDLILLSSYSALGTALLAALVLIAFNHVQTAVAGFWITGCAIAIGLLFVRLIGISTTTEGTYLASCMLLLCCMTALAVRTLRDPLALV